MWISSGGSSGACDVCQRISRVCHHAEDEAMSEVLTVDAILFGLLVFSGILGNISVIHVVRQIMENILLSSLS